MQFLAPVFGFSPDEAPPVGNLLATERCEEILDPLDLVGENTLEGVKI